MSGHESQFVSCSILPFNWPYCVVEKEMVVLICYVADLAFHSVICRAHMIEMTTRDVNQFKYFQDFYCPIIDKASKTG